jgi:hypothetical protein
VLVYFLCFLIYSYFAWEGAWCLTLVSCLVRDTKYVMPRSLILKT